MSDFTFNNGIHRTALLAKTAVDALGHVDIVSRGPPAAIHTLFCLNRDSLSWTDGFAKLAGNATLLSSGISS